MFYRITNLILVVPFSCLMQCSSLSVFALHPLYLRVEAISANIPEDIKVLILVFIMLHLCIKHLFLLDQLNSGNSIFIPWTCVTISLLIHSKRSGRQEFSWIKRYSQNSSILNLLSEIVGNKGIHVHLNCCFYTSSLFQPISCQIT